MKEEELKQLRDAVFTQNFCQLINLSGAVLEEKEEKMEEYVTLIKTLHKEIQHKKVAAILMSLAYLLLQTTYNNKDVMNFVGNMDSQIKTDLYIR